MMNIIFDEFRHQLDPRRFGKVHHTKTSRNNLLAYNLVVQLSKKKQRLVVIVEHGMRAYGAVDELLEAIETLDVDAEYFKSHNRIMFSNGSRINFVTPDLQRLIGLQADVCWISERY